MENRRKPLVINSGVARPELFLHTSSMPENVYKIGAILKEKSKFFSLRAASMAKIKVFYVNKNFIMNIFFTHVIHMCNERCAHD